MPFKLAPAYRFVFNLCIAALYAAVLLAIWQAAVSWWGAPSFILPPPGDVLKEYQTYPALFVRHAIFTSSAAVIGALSAIAGGLAIGVLLRFGGVFARALEPVVVAMQVFPKEALGPLLLILFGYGLESKVAISTMIAMFPVIVSTQRGLTETPASYVRLMDAMGAKGLQKFAAVQLPHALPFIFSGIRVSVTLALIGAIVGEYLGSSAGLGYLMKTSLSEQATARIYAAMLLLGGIGGLLYMSVHTIEHWLFRPYLAGSSGAGKKE
ncbi:MAG: ABC transporter permease [Alphaproteobacteria bacterium]|nr:ABC transporter permease [Alphaproteobacteria bacterium]